MLPQPQPAPQSPAIATTGVPRALPPSGGKRPLQVLYLFAGTPRKLDMAACLQHLAATWDSTSTLEVWRR